MANGKGLDFEEIHKILQKIAENQKNFEERFNMEVEIRRQDAAERRKEEARRKKEEAKRRKEEVAERKAEAKRRKEEAAERRKEEAKRRKEEAAERRKEEAKRRKEEVAERKAEAKRRKEEAAERRKEEAKRRKEEATRRRKVEARRRKIEEEDRKAEAERQEELAKWRNEQKEKNKELDKLYERTERQIFNVDGKHSKAWGDFSETCIKEGAIKAFNSVGFPVDHYYANEKAAYENIQHPEKSRCWEFDLIAFSHEHKIAIPTEVKTTLARSHINDFTKKLKRFLHLIRDPRTHKDLDGRGQALLKLLQGKKIYGAVGYVNLHKKEKRGIIQHAQENGLLVLSATKDSAKVVTPQDFQPILFKIPPFKG